MIIGIGVDMVSIPRVEKSLARFGDEFARKVLSEEEMAGYGTARNRATWLAKRFAAKEAVAKALGTGMGAGVYFTQIAVIKKRSGAPSIELSGAAKLRAERLGAGDLHLSITDEAEYAIAFAVLESG